MCNKTNPNLTFISVEIYNTKSIVIAVLLLFLSGISSAQKNKIDLIFAPNLQIGITAGPSTSFGDIKQNQFFPSSEEWRFAYGLNLNYNVSSIFTIRFQGLYGELSGSRSTENIWFENDYYEINVNSAINIINLFGENNENRLVNPYGVIGFGLINYNTVVKRLDEYYVLKRIGYGFGTGIDGRYRQEFLMFGAGINIRVNKRISILLESANKLPFSDLLDGVESGKHNDLFNYTSVGLTYRFAFKKKKPVHPDPVLYLESLSAIPAKDIGTNLMMDLDCTLIERKLQTVVFTTGKEADQEQQLIYEFRVQILAEYGKPFSKDWISENYKIPLSEIKEDKMNKFFIYTTGSFDTYEEANGKCKELQTFNGIHEAFVVAFKNGTRVFPAPRNN